MPVTYSGSHVLQKRDLLDVLSSQASPPSSGNHVWRAEPAGNGYSIDKFLAKRPLARPAHGDEKDLYIVFPDKEALSRASHKSPDAVKDALYAALKAYRALNKECDEVYADPTLDSQSSDSVDTGRARHLQVLVQDFDKELTHLVKYESGVTSGKIECLVSADEFDSTRRSIALSMSDGDLSKCDANLYALRSDRADWDHSGQASISLYCGNVWDKSVAKEAVRILFEEHGVLPTAVRSDVGVTLGITRDNTAPMSSEVYDVDFLLTRAEQARISEDHEMEKRLFFDGPGSRTNSSRTQSEASQPVKGAMSESSA